jgi:hypothetical protein
VVQEVEHLPSKQKVLNSNPKYNQKKTLNPGCVLSFPLFGNPRMGISQAMGRGIQDVLALSKPCSYPGT